MRSLPRANPTSSAFAVRSTSRLRGWCSAPAPSPTPLSRSRVGQYRRLSLADCTSGQKAFEQASGVDLSLMIDTGVGPLVLSASAWARVVAAAAKNQPAITLPLPPRRPRRRRRRRSTWQPGRPRSTSCSGRPSPASFSSTSRPVRITIPGPASSSVGPGAPRLSRTGASPPARSISVVPHVTAIPTIWARRQTARPIWRSAANPGRGHLRRRPVPTGTALRHPARRARARRPGRCQRPWPLPAGARLRLLAVARCFLLRGGCPTGRLLGSSPLPAAPGRLVEALLLRPWAARAAGQLRPGRRCSAARRLRRRGRRRTPGRPSRKCDRLQPIRWPAD